MSAFLSVPYSQRRGNARLHAALAFSLLLHTLMMLGLPHLPQDLLGGLGDPEFAKRGGTSLPLAVRINMRPSPQTPPAEEAAAPPQPRQVQPRTPPKPPSAATKGSPRVLLAERAPEARTGLPKPELAPLPGGDFLADLNARQRARDKEAQPPAPPVPTGANGAPAALSFGSAAGPGGEWRDGGIFRVERMTRYDATLVFYRSNRDVQRVEVEIGNSITIQLAVVRAVIAVMRDSGFTGDVNWMSERLGRVVELSARPRDTVKLEAFLLSEFFPADPMRRPRDTAASRP
jgi:hypothetical protein